jgi:hypothetical protein
MTNQAGPEISRSRRWKDDDDDEREVERPLKSMAVVDLLALESLFELLIELVAECGYLVARQINEF